MKAVPLKLENGRYQECQAEEATHIVLNVPGPYPTRIIPIMIGGTKKGTGNWTWNGDVDNPTLKPSVLTSAGPESKICHSFINDGQIKFLDDCSHEFAGQTMDLLEVEW